MSWCACSSGAGIRSHSSPHFLTPSPTPLFSDIQDIRPGTAAEPLARGAAREAGDSIMRFSGLAGRNLDVQMPSQEGRDWLFVKFSDLFSAIAKAHKEGHTGTGIAARVKVLMGG